MKIWGTGKLREPLVNCFSDLLGQQWIFEGFDRQSGEIRWMKKISEDYTFKLAVHPTSLRENGYNFQTTIYFYSPGIVRVGNECKYVDHVPLNWVDIFQTKGLILGVYLDGLEKYVSKLETVRLKTWNLDDGVARATEWLESIDLYFSFLGNRLQVPENVPDVLIEISRLEKSVVPPPFCLYLDPFISASSAALIVGRKNLALDLLLLGRSEKWLHGGKSQFYDEIIEVKNGIAACMIAYFSL
jgi:hypothetical protein